MVTLFSGEAGLHQLQLGYPEGTRGTYETTTILFPASAEGIIEEDRAWMSPNEDYGVLAMHQPDRGIYGVRLATLPFRSVGLFEYMLYHLGMCIEGGVSATHPVVGVDQYVFTRDMTGDSLDTGTWQEGDNAAVFGMVDSIIRTLHLSFSPLQAPGNVPLAVEADYFGKARVLCDGNTSPFPNGFDPDATAILNPEPIVGQTARLYLGAPATAYASLSEAVGLISADFTIPSGKVPRKYGSADDEFTHIGVIKSAPAGTLSVYENASRLADLYALWADPDPAAHNLRSRLAFNGREIGSTGHFYGLTFDQMIELKTLPVKVAGDGGRSFDGEFEAVYDSDLGSDLQVTLTLPTPA